MTSLNGTRRLTWRTMHFLIAGLLAGAVLVQPAVAHVKKSLSHLTKHLDPRYYNVGEKVGDADTLDGVDSSGFARAGAAPSAHNHDDRYFTEAESDTRYYNVGEQVGDADTLDGYDSSGLVRAGGARTTTFGAMPSCTTPLDYLTVSFTAPQAGFALVNGSFTGDLVDAPTEMTAVLVRTAPTALFGLHQQERVAMFDEGNISLTEVFPVAAGPNTFVLRVCDGSDANGATTELGQLTILYSAFNLAGSPTRGAMEVPGSKP